MIESNRLVQQFISLVQIDSETKHEQAISQVLQFKLRELGFEVEEDETAHVTGHGSGNLCCMLPARSSNTRIPTIFFTCHMDTVSPGKGIQPIIGSDGIIRSNGTTILGSDDKAGIAALLEAIRVIQEQNLEHGPIQFIITAGEESGLKGARAMQRSQCKAQFGFALDANGPVGHLVTAASGRAEITISFQGKSAHAGVNPEDGISAIQVASKAVSRMSLGRIDSETTANIGSFSGKSPLNVVCDSVTIQAEARSSDLQKLQKQIDAMKRACHEAAEELDATYQFESNIAYLPFRIPDDAPVVQLISRAYRSIGIEPKTASTGGGSDANIFNLFGIPTVNLAVGYQDIHTVHEHIAIQDLVQITQCVVAIIQETVKSSNEV